MITVNACLGSGRNHILMFCTEVDVKISQETNAGLEGNFRKLYIECKCIAQSRLGLCDYQTVPEYSISI